MAAITLGKTRLRNRQEDIFIATQWTLMWRKFRKHKLAMLGTAVVALFYLVAIFCEFIAPQDPLKRTTDYIYVPPQGIHLIGSRGVGPFVYGLKQEEDPVTWRKTYKEDPSLENPLTFFVKGDKYSMWGLIESDIHLFGTQQGQFFLLGTDDSGRDVFSRVVYGIRISMSIGLVGVMFTFILGSVLGAISGYYGGVVDFVIQRIIEFILSMPAIPLWMTLSAALPKEWAPTEIYFAISIILSLIGWCGLARVVRGKMLEMREEDYIAASKLAGASDAWIIFDHMLPGFISYLIVNITLSIPAMILAETSLSFLGVGLRPPAISLGVLLQQAQNVRTIALHPWLMVPGIFIFVVVLAFNFMGDGLRDAADPYK
ncbi:MAG: ABC transporter permease [Chloroflexi bacterium]|nr:ABC transporter permease [Chloroflexota bacterium]